MVTEKFRRQLRQEAEKWWQEGWIDASLYQRLFERYQLDEIEASASNRFVTILLSLGGILLGLGVITFVAANWQEWSREFRVFLLMGLFIGVNAAGFYLWRRSASSRGLQRLGHGLLLTGALILGANMALMSQMFHQSGAVYELYFVWGLGVTAMAYSLRLVSLGVLAWILLFISYWVWWFSASFTQEATWIELVMNEMALVASLVFIPLAYWCRSRLLFCLGGIAFATCFVFGIRPLSLWNNPDAGWLVAIAFALPAALLWAYNLDVWRFSRTSGSRVASPVPVAIDPFQSIARSLAVWFFSFVFYVFAFHWFWSDSLYRSTSDRWNWQPWYHLDVILFMALTVLGWLRLSYQLRSLTVFQEKSVNTGAIAVFTILTAAIFFWHMSVQPLPIIAPFLLNLMLFLLAIALIRDGLALGNRRTFWGGMSLLVLSIISRMLEYDTDLLLKAFVFVLCGVGVIAAGLYFERNLKPSRTVLPANSSPESMP